MASLNRYANVINGIVDSITFSPDLDEDGNVIPPWILVPDYVFAGFAQGPNGTWLPPEPEIPEEPDPTDSIPQTVGVVQLNVVDGEVAALPLTSRFSAAMRMGTGEYWVFFKETQPDTKYLALVYSIPSANGYVLESNKFEDFFIVNVTDFADAPADATSLSIEVKRVV